MSISFNGTSGLTFPDASTQATGGYTGFRNRIINGGMTIDQRNAGALVAGAAGYIFAVDRTPICVFGGGTGRISGQQSTNTPAGASFVNSLIATVTTADASPTAAFGYCLLHRVEGFNVADLKWGAAGASAITVSFWARSSLTGSYVFTVSNIDNTRSYSATYTIFESNAWELKTITIPGDTSGTWETGNGRGIQATWGLGGGSDRQAQAINAWGLPAAHVTDASGCVDWIATSGATFYITGVQLEKGSVATPFEFRPYGTELQLCERYYQQWGGNSGYERIGNGFNYASTHARVDMVLVVTMRATPTLTVSNASDWAVEGPGYMFACTSISLDQPSSRIAAANFSVASGLTAGQGVHVMANNTSNARLNLSSEL